jgi:thiamine pyrophosphate-dependent acetolactate synthase large subunit-like protein
MPANEQRRFKRNVRGHTGARYQSRYPADIGLVGNSQATLRALLPRLAPHEDRTFLQRV